MSLDYLKFVEAHESYRTFNVFEKVLMATKRAKAIYNEEKEHGMDEEMDRRNIKRRTIPHKPTYRAILEINEGKLTAHYPTPEELRQAKLEMAAKKENSEEEEFSE